MSNSKTYESKYTVLKNQRNPAIKNNPADKSVTAKKVIFRTYQIIWYILGVFEALILFRFIFRLSAANPGSPFVKLIYQLSAPIMAPFLGIYPTTSFESAVFEWVDFIAMVVYAIIAYGLVYLFQLVKPVKKDEVERVVDNP